MLTGIPARGVKFGMLQSLGEVQRRGSSEKAYWYLKMRCTSCSKFIWARLDHVKIGAITRCTCVKHRPEEYVGKKIGVITVLSVRATANGYAKALCLCSLCKKKNERTLPHLRAIQKSGGLGCYCTTKKAYEQRRKLRRGFRPDGSSLTFVKSTDDTLRLFLCKCDCGNKVTLKPGLFLNRYKKSCGCQIGRAAKTIRVFGRSMTLLEAAKLFGSSWSKIRHRLDKGMAPEAAVLAHTG